VLTKIKDITPVSLDAARTSKQLFRYEYESNKTILPCRTAQYIADQLPNGHYLIDVKIHLLKIVGSYPCIPGWHCDEVYRKNNELDWFMTNPDRHFYLCLFDYGTGSLTEFCDYEISDDYNKFKQHKDINEYIKNNKSINIIKTQPNVIYKFNVNDPHRGIESTGSGWRYFFRATVLSDLTPRNEIREQSQVYVPLERLEDGW
jgi:hypothetical protein